MESEHSPIVCDPPALNSDTLHIWSGQLDVEAGLYHRLAACLTPDERKRAEQFRFDTDRRRFTMARAVLRHILAAYLDRAPHKIRFCYGPHGKPHLLSDESAAIQFNLAHSDGLALIALTEERTVGVDLERIRPPLVTDALAAATMSPVELTLFRGLPPNERVRLFFSIWTRKEAYLKAAGCGLSRRLDGIEVLPAATLDADGRDQPQRVDGWIVRSLAPMAGYAAAVAVAVAKPTAGGPPRPAATGEPVDGFIRLVEHPWSGGIARPQVIDLGLR